jgi:hypothetical protein
MFSTCCFCHASLGTNDAIEHFPVGRRLAFDGDRGRLWAVCSNCKQWNLAPIEERWEAIEACERAYRGVTQRVSSDNIALARLKEGTDLVRIGRPLLPEFAAWRHGGEYIARHRIAQRWMFAPTAAQITVAVMNRFSVSLSGAAFAYSVYGGAALQLGVLGAVLARDRVPRSVITRDAQGTWAVSTRDAMRSRVRRHADGGWTLGLFVRRVHATPRALSRGSRAFVWLGSGVQERRYESDEALQFLPRLLAAAHRNGADRGTLDASVQTLTTRIHDATVPPSAAIGDLLGMPELGDGRYGEYASGRPLEVVPQTHRLAAEMALHEEDERRLLAGELASLYARWEEAERIARIADGELTKLAETE